MPIDACDLCHSQPCRPDCPDPCNMTGLSWAEEHFKAQLGEVEAASRLVAVLGNDQAMAVLREFRVTKREV